MIIHNAKSIIQSDILHHPSRSIWNLHENVPLFLNPSDNFHLFSATSVFVYRGLCVLLGTNFKQDQLHALLLQVSILQAINTKEKAAPLLLELLCVIWEPFDYIRLMLSIQLDTDILKLFFSSSSHLHKQEEIYHCSPLRFTTILESTMVVKTLRMS